MKVLCLEKLLNFQKKWWKPVVFWLGTILIDLLTTLNWRFWKDGASYEDWGFFSCRQRLTWFGEMGKVVCGNDILEVTELRKVKDLQAWGCSHSQGKHSQRRLHKCAAETRDSPGYSHSPGQRRGPKGLVWTTSWADLKTARTLNMLLYPNTRAIHVAQW